jgi:hypothetical protein
MQRLHEDHRQRNHALSFPQPAETRGAVFELSDAFDQVVAAALGVPP